MISSYCAKIKSVFQISGSADQRSSLRRPRLDGTLERQGHAANYRLTISKFALEFRIGNIHSQPRRVILRWLNSFLILIYCLCDVKCCNKWGNGNPDCRKCHVTCRTYPTTGKGQQSCVSPKSKKYSLPSSESECNMYWISNGRVYAAILHESLRFKFEWLRVDRFIVEHRPVSHGHETDSATDWWGSPSICDNNGAARKPVSLIHIIDGKDMWHS